MPYNNPKKDYGNEYGLDFANGIDKYQCFGNNCPKIKYNLFKPRLQDDSLYPFKHSVLDQYGNSEFDY